MTADKSTKNEGADAVEETKAAAEKPAAKKTAAKKPAAKKPAAKKPAAKKPAAKKPAAKKPAAKKPAAKKPAAKKPAAKKPAAESVEKALAEVEEAARKKPPVKKSAKSGAARMIRITQTRSQIGYARAQRQVLAGLGLGRVGRTVVRVDDPCIRGMVTKVSHLVSVEKVEA